MKSAFGVVEAFEEKLAEFTGAQYAVTTSTGTAAIFLALMYERLERWEPAPLPTIICPARTFISVPMAIKQAGFGLLLKDYDWSGAYRLHPTEVVDSALRFNKQCYSGLLRGTLSCLSFHARKTLNIGEGGAILTDSYEAKQWLRAARYSGRGFNSTAFDVQKVSMMGWQLYMNPEKAARGLHLLEYERDMRYELPDQAMEYPDLRKAPFFKDDQ